MCDLTARTQVITKETAQNVVFKTRDREQGGAWIHRNYMTEVKQSSDQSQAAACSFGLHR